MGKRNVRGPFNAVMDPTEFGAGSALLEVTEAVKESGKYNVWEEETELATKVRVSPSQLLTSPAKHHVATSHLTSTVCDRCSGRR